MAQSGGHSCQMRVKPRSIVVTLAVALAFLAAVVVAVRATPAVAEWRIDGASGIVNAILHGENTVFADGYTADGFRAVEPGMTREEVHELLGSPLESWDGTGDSTWDAAERWSLSPGDSRYRFRAVYYRDGRVVAKRGEFVVD